MDSSQRKLRNLLIDRRFQLHFAFRAVAGAALVAGLMGGFLWWTSRELKGQVEEAVDARATAAETSKELGLATLSNKLLERLDDPTIEAELREESRRIDARYEAERAAITAERTALLHRQRMMGAAIALGFGFLSLLVVLLGIADTHRVVGPLHRLQKLLQEVGEGTLIEAPRLREHDQLQGLFDAFNRMNEELRAKSGRDLERVDRALRAMEAGDAATASIELQHLRAEYLGQKR